MVGRPSPHWRSRDERDGQDSDGDGDPDLVTAESGNSALAVFINDGSGAFPTPAFSITVGRGIFDLPPLTNPTSVLAIDATGDGKLDLVSAQDSTYSNVSVLAGNADGTFRSGVDYATKLQTLVWNSGETNSKPFTISIKDDSVVEGDEFVSLLLSNPTGGAVFGTNATSMLRINDNDSEAGFADVNFIAREESGQAVITLRRLRGSKGSITVSLETVPDVGMDNIDFVPIVKSHTFSSTAANVDLTASALTIALPDRGFSDGQGFILRTTTMLPSGLMPNVPYTMTNVTFDAKCSLHDD